MKQALHDQVYKLDESGSGLYIKPQNYTQIMTSTEIHPIST